MINGDYLLIQKLFCLFQGIEFADIEQLQILFSSSPEKANNEVFSFIDGYFNCFLSYGNSPVRGPCTSARGCHGVA